MSIQKIILSQLIAKPLAVKLDLVAPSIILVLLVPLFNALIAIGSWCRFLIIRLILSCGKILRGYHHVEKSQPLTFCRVSRASRWRKRQKKRFGDLEPRKCNEQSGECGHEKDNAELVTFHGSCNNLLERDYCIGVRMPNRKFWHAMMWWVVFVVRRSVWCIKNVERPSSLFVSCRSWAFGTFGKAGSYPRRSCTVVTGNENEPSVLHQSFGRIALGFVLQRQNSTLLTKQKRMVAWSALLMTLLLA